MSCGNHHDVSCREVLDKVFEFLDSECDDRSSTHIAQHLDECGPCLQLFGIEREIKALVHRKCGGDPAPAGLHERVRLRLRMVTVEESYRSRETVARGTATHEGVAHEGVAHEGVAHEGVAHETVAQETVIRHYDSVAGGPETTTVRETSYRRRVSGPLDTGQG